MKITIRLAKGKKAKKRWWITCTLCGMKNHVHLQSWPAAIEFAQQHAQGGKHLHRLAHARKWAS